MTNYSDYDYKYIYGADENEYYDTDNNPSNITAENLLLILEKYDNDVYENIPNDNDMKELRRIIMLLYESTIDNLQSDLQDYIDILMWYKYKHDVRDIHHMERICNTMHKIIKRSERNGCTRIINIFQNGILSRENIINTYNNCTNYYHDNLNMNTESDISDLTDKEIFNIEGLKKFLRKYSVNEIDIEKIIEGNLSGGYFNEY